MYISDFLNIYDGMIFSRGPELSLPADISIDTRTIREGQVFLALKGDRTDGHQYIEKAVTKGASGVIIQKDSFNPTDILASVSCICVEDTESFITDLALFYLEKVNPGELIAITGSVGKTTTRELTRNFLSLKYYVHGPVSSFNTKLGCSLTVTSMPENTEVLILEMGANHPGEIKEMAQLFMPTTAVITDVKEAHLAGLKDVSGVLEAKMEIATSPRLNRFFYNADNPELCKAVNSLTGSVRKISVGTENGDVRICRPEFWIDSDKGIPMLQFTLSTAKSRPLKIVTHLFGIHQARCLALAAAVSMDMGIDEYMIEEKAVVSFSDKGRGKVFFLRNKSVLIDDSYNANPASMLAALATLTSMDWPGRKIAILGGMKELGAVESQKHLALFPLMASLDVILFVGQEWRCLSDLVAAQDMNCRFLDYAEEALRSIIPLMVPGDLILVKGSNSNGLNMIIDELVKSK